MQGVLWELGLDTPGYPIMQLIRPRHPNQEIQGRQGHCHRRFERRTQALVASQSRHLAKHIETVVRRDICYPSR